MRSSSAFPRALRRSQTRTIATRRLRWIGFSVACFVVFLAVAAYTAIPTVASHALFSPGAPTDALLQGGEFSSYAEGPLALASLMLNESLANQRPEFCSVRSFGSPCPLGLILWALAIGWVVRGIRRRSFAGGERVLLIVGLVCLLVSMGDVIPGRRPRLVADRAPSGDQSNSNAGSPDRFRSPDGRRLRRFVARISFAQRGSARIRLRGARRRRGGESRALFLLRVFLGDYVHARRKDAAPRSYRRRRRGARQSRGRTWRSSTPVPFSIRRCTR